MLQKFIDWFKPLPPAAEKITDPAEINKQYKRWRLRLFISAYIGYAMYYVTRQNLNPIAHVFKAETGITNDQFGLMVSISLIAYGVGKFVSGMLADKSNIRVFLAFGLMASSIINLFFGYLTSFFLLVLFWTLNQSFQSMGFPPIARIFAYWFSPKERASKWTLWASAHTVGISIAAIIAAGVLKGMNITPHIHWQYVFVICGILGLITSFYILRNVTDTPVSVGLPPVEEYTGCQQLVTKQESDGESYWVLLRKYVLTNKYIWILSVAFLCVYFVRYVTLSWAAIFLDSRELSKASIPLIFTLNPLVGALGGIVAGILTDKVFKGRCTPTNIIYLIALGISAYCFYLFAGPNHLFLTCFFIATLGFFVDGPQNLINVQISLLTTKESVAAACGFCGLFGYIGGFLAGSGASFILDKWGWAGVFNSCIVACVVGILLIMTAWKKENSDIKVETK
ncbi:MAG: MFS transporter [Elusimicrobium sp.]|uniref:MFS transporter n=1 Tax=Candidatus Avelusimicrobium gallicola TaxID=2562704 RepID=A0A928DP08_9BACT|nr:MFS transporter [Elusimicrobium sp.]